jgi:DMSO/TMAO reductase YedYZ molybdopterin-dependent catalytic subunit
VLLRAGLEEGDARLRHVQFEGLDRDFEKNYGASIPIDKALSPDGDVILALQVPQELKKKKRKRKHARSLLSL